MRHKHRNGNHSQSLSTTLPKNSVSANVNTAKTWQPLIFFHRYIVPSRRACLISLCWVIWFICHTITMTHDHHLAILQGHHYGNNQQHISKPNQRQLIRGSIIRNLPTHGLHADGTDIDYRCQIGEIIHHPKAYRLWGGLNGTRQPLPHPLNGSGVLDFATHISQMKLRLLIVGNSLGEQLAAGMEEAVCYPVNISMDTSMSSIVVGSGGRGGSRSGGGSGSGVEERKVWSKRFKRGHCKTSFAENTNETWIKEPRIVTTKDGGMVGVIKDNTNMINTTKWRSNNTAISSLVKLFLANNNNNGIDKHNTNIEEKELLDVFIYQFQSGHVDLHDFDEYYLQQAIEVAGALFGAKAVIFPTIAWMNNIDKERVDIYRQVNDRIRAFARSYASSLRGSTVQSVQVLEFAKLSDAYIESNARILGIPKGETYTMRIDNLWGSLVAQICASLPFEEDVRGCLPGMVANDGMHQCPETFHGRVNAALVCLLDCRFNQRLLPSSILSCSDGCNSKYMNVDPIIFTLNADLNEEISLTQL